MKHHTGGLSWSHKVPSLFPCNGWPNRLPFVGAPPLNKYKTARSAAGGAVPLLPSPGGVAGVSQNSTTRRTDNCINISFHHYEDTTPVTKGKVQRDNSRFVNHLPDRWSDWRLMGVHTIADHTKTSRLVDSVMSSISIAAPLVRNTDLVGSIRQSATPEWGYS